MHVGIYVVVLHNGPNGYLDDKRRISAGKKCLFSTLTMSPTTTCVREGERGEKIGRGRE